MVNKANLITRIADLAREKKIDVESPISTMNQIAKGCASRLTSEETSVLSRFEQLVQIDFDAIVVHVQHATIVDGTPRVLGLKQILQYYLKHLRGRHSSQDCI